MQNCTINYVALRVWDAVTLASLTLLIGYYILINVSIRRPVVEEEGLGRLWVYGREADILA